MPMAGGATRDVGGTSSGRRYARRAAVPSALAIVVVVETVSEPGAAETLSRWGERLARLGRERLRDDDS